MAKKRSHTVRLPIGASPLIGTIRVSELERKIRKSGVKKSQLFKSKKTYSRGARKSEERKLIKNRNYEI